MLIRAEHVDMIRKVLFGTDEQVDEQLQNVSDDDDRAFGCLLVATLVELVERTLGRRPHERADFVRLAAHIRTGEWTDLDPTAVEAVLRLLYGDESVLQHHETQEIVGVQLLVAYAFIEQLQLEDNEEFLDATRERAEQLAELAAI